jgi:phosphoglycolate phosphatase
MTLQAKRFPNAVLFDWDNTLVDTTRDTLRALNAVCAAFEYRSITLEEFHTKPSLSIRAFIRTMVPESDVLRAESIFFQNTSHLDAVLLPHAHTIAIWLHDLKIPTGVVSNKGGDRLRKEIQRLGLSHVFDCAIGSGDTSEDKPSGGPLLHALSQKNLAPSEDIWFVGDSVVDMMCAHHAGCTPVSVGPQADAFAHPKIKAQNCHGLWKILKSLKRPSPHGRSTGSSGA